VRVLPLLRFSAARLKALKSGYTFFFELSLLKNLNSKFEIIILNVCVCVLCLCLCVCVCVFVCTPTHQSPLTVTGDTVHHLYIRIC